MTNEAPLTPYEQATEICKRYDLPLPKNTISAAAVGDVYVLDHLYSTFDGVCLEPNLPILVMGADAAYISVAIIRVTGFTQQTAPIKRAYFEDTVHNAILRRRINRS